MSDIKEDKILLVKGAAGLGNRILCALTGILYARLTRRRLLIDWSDGTYSDDGSNVFYRFFQCHGCSSTDEIPVTDSVRPHIWCGHLHESSAALRKLYAPKSRNSPLIWRQFSVDLSSLDYQEDVLVMWSYMEQVDTLRKHFNGEFKELRRASKKAILKRLLREDLILHPSIRERVDQVRSDWFDKKTVGVHIRYMDKKACLRLIHKRLNALLKRQPEMQVFLATDNVEIKDMFQENYSSVITTQKWYPTSGSSMHHNPECPDRTENGIGALVDMYLLAECDYLILDESSSFSYIASLLVNRSNSKVFDVQRGYWLPPRVRHLIWLFRIGLQSLVSWTKDVRRRP